MTGIVTDIQRFSIHDGPGIRTSVFLKGCNLRCAWCHNPETLRPGPEIQLFPARCIGCDACLAACPHDAHARLDGRRVFHRERCAACGACAQTCYAGALVLVGRTLSAEAVMAEVLEDRPFYETSGGGMTLSGGEPLCQRDFALELLTLAQAEGLHTAIDTNLAWPWDDLAPLLPLVDLVLADIKTMDGRLHEEWTGAPNGLILENTRRLAREPRPLVVRTPVVPGVNDTPGAIGGIADFIAGFPNLEYYELLPYHPLGTGKYTSLGLDYPLASLKAPSAEQMQRLAAVARQRGIPVRPAGEGPT